MATEIPWPRRLLQVMRSSHEDRLFFVRGVIGELLGLQVARSRSGGYVDALTLGYGKSLTYLRYEIFRRSPL